MMEFIEFAKIVSLSRECIITEKIDGTNGCICIGEDGEFLVGSQTRWITPEQDNHGFARWAYDNKDELMKLGAGRHFGEWWGSGIQRGYGLQKGEKRFSLFNVYRWGEERPACCNVVPTLFRGMFDTTTVQSCLDDLQKNGSYAAQGFMKPEGIIIFHTAFRRPSCGLFYPVGGFLFKKTIEKDEVPKCMQR